MPRPKLRSLSAVTLVLCVGGSPAGASITGLCPDGSLFIVQREESIPCEGAKQIEPHEVPPIRPQLLPRPYTWQVYTRQADPNNPYNLIDAARAVRALAAGQNGSGEEGSAPAPEPTPAPLAADRSSSPVVDPLGLGEDQLRDLFLIVELSQQDAAASFVKETADGREAFALAFAHSPAFERHLRANHRRAAELPGGPVLLFQAVAQQAEAFHANLTFTQDHLAFSPDPANAAQLGLLLGRLGDLDAGEVTLGWVALPPSVDLGRALDVYWNDRHLTTRFR